MPRPFKCRHIGCKPRVCYFKPRGIPLTALGEVVLTVDEFEAVRLADLEGMYQDDGAKKMKVSRQTFGNIVNAARNKIADALVNGKAMKIEGGVYQMPDKRRFECYKCSHAWEIAYGTGRPAECPKCHNENIHRAEEDRGRAGPRSFGRRRRKCRRMPL